MFHLCILLYYVVLLKASKTITSPSYVQSIAPGLLNKIYSTYNIELIMSIVHLSITGLIRPHKRCWLQENKPYCRITRDIFKLMHTRYHLCRCRLFKNSEVNTYDCVYFTVCQAIFIDFLGVKPNNRHVIIIMINIYNKLNFKIILSHKIQKRAVPYLWLLIT